MAATRNSWQQVLALYERGDPAFVDELRRCDDADQLGDFAATWIADPRPFARQFLLDYLARPLNAFRHEALVKRLFKLAEKAGDDQVLGRFLVLFDRSVRREHRFRRRFESRNVANREQALALVRQWEAEGAESTRIHEWNGFRVFGQWRVAAIGTPRDTTMPRQHAYRYRQPDSGAVLGLTELVDRAQLPEDHARALGVSDRLRRQLRRFRLFSMHTRNYLRRRAWRYFRKLGKNEPTRYTPAVTELLKQYTDDDAGDGLALLDNWGLMHILFHHCPAIVAKKSGWKLAPGRKLSELAAAPIFEDLWQEAPQKALELLQEAQCRPVRQWALRRLRKDPRYLASRPLEQLLSLLAHADADIVAIVAEVLRTVPGLDAVPVERWYQLLEKANGAALTTLCELVERHVSPDRVAVTDALRMARSRPAPLARLGLRWLQANSGRLSADNVTALLGLSEAESSSVRPELVRWARSVLSGAPEFHAFWLLEYLDSRHDDVRHEGWNWFLEEPRARENVDLWRRLLESPYDDVRLHLVAELEHRTARSGSLLAGQQPLDPELLRLLWASVLLNIHRGNRAKPVVVQQIVRRLEKRPEEADRLVPLLSVALRSVRGPEWRAGLAGIVGLLERNPELEGPLRAGFPELKW